MDTTTMDHVNSADRELQKRLCRILAGQHFHVLRDLQVEVTSRLVTLAGTVNSFYEKQIAIQACRQLKGVRLLVDEIVVSLPDQGHSEAS